MVHCSSGRRLTTRKVRSSVLRPAVLAVALAVISTLCREASFTAGPIDSLTRQQIRSQSRVARACTSWQERLDKALLSVDAKPATRLRNLQKVLENPTAVIEDVGRAVSVLAEKGFREGHPEAIDTLWPKGTIARADLEALQALRKQVPEVVADLENLGASAESQTRANQPTVSLEKVAADLLELASNPKKQEELREEAKNVLRSKPLGLETPTYTVVRTLSAGSVVVELRRYEPFTVARRAMPDGNGTGFSSGQGFTTLADYLFGKNSNGTAMEMTSPVEISYDGSQEAVMSFVLPKAFADSPPSPEEATIELAEVPERLVAVKAFPGVVTQGEIERQRAALAEVLAADGDQLLPVSASEYSVLQYNPPYTLPWRRLNELAVVVTEVRLTPDPPPSDAAPDGESAAAAAGAAEAELDSAAPARTQGAPSSDDDPPAAKAESSRRR